MTARSTLALAAFALAALCPGAALAQKGGTITGTVLWAGKAIPANPPANVNKDKEHCGTKILQNELVVDPKSKGVANVMVWLVDASDPDKKIPFKGKQSGTVVIRQPKCEFVPRVLFITPDQKLEVVNDATIAHNIRIDGGTAGPSINPLMPPKTTFKVPDAVKPRAFPIPFSCSIHPWMKGYLFAVPSPYAAVTTLDPKGKESGTFKIENVPPGKYKLMAWHEKYGFLLWAPGEKTAANRGKPITITAGKTHKEPTIRLRPTE